MIFLVLLEKISISALVRASFTNEGLSRTGVWHSRQSSHADTRRRRPVSVETFCQGKASKSFAVHVPKAVEEEEKMEDYLSCSDSTVKIIDEEDLPDVWSTYCEAMEDIMSRARVLQSKNKKTTLTKDELQPVQEYLLSNSVVLRPPSLEDDRSDYSYRDEFMRQSELFRNSTGFTDRQYDYLTRCLTYIGDVSAKKQSSFPVVVAWSKLQEAGITPRENCVSTYMYVLSLGTDKRSLQDSFQVATFHDHLFEPNEKTITLRIKSLIANGDASGAERVLSSLQDKGDSNAEWRRLRTFQPILSYYCSSDCDAIDSVEGRENLSSAALRLFRQMRQSDGVFLDAETYALLLGCLARRGYFRANAGSGIESDLGFSADIGPGLFNDIVSEMGEDLLELTEDAVITISESLRGSFGLNVSSPLLEEGLMGLEKGLLRDDTKDRALFTGRVLVDAATGICNATGTKLRLFALTNEQRRHVHDTLLEMAASQHEEYGEKLRAKGKVKVDRDGTYAREQLLEFSSWLQNRDGQPFTAFVDGPNVAYFGHGSVHYSQVQSVVEELERMGERPLVTMPQKYVSNNFWLASLGRMQELTDRELTIMNNLLNDNKMYAVPAACLDDYYWMLASVANQTTSRLNVVSTDDDKGRFPGLRPMLVTNDQMRDHRLSLLEPREFRRWTSCHIVNYDISPYENDEWEERTIQLYPADFFSREIQGNKHPDCNDTMVWHIPVSEWPEPGRFCVFIRG